MHVVEIEVHAECALPLHGSLAMQAHIDGGRCMTLAVTRCEPELACRAQLEAALLRGGSTDLPGFVAAMRRQFQALLAAGAA